MLINCISLFKHVKIQFQTMSHADRAYYPLTKSNPLKIRNPLKNCVH